MITRGSDHPGGCDGRHHSRTVTIVQGGGDDDSHGPQGRGEEGLIASGIGIPPRGSPPGGPGVFAGFMELLVSPS